MQKAYELCEIFNEKYPYDCDSAFFFKIIIKYFFFNYKNSKYLFLFIRNKKNFIPYLSLSIDYLDIRKHFVEKYSSVAQWKRAGLITQRSVDRNYSLLLPLFFSFFRERKEKKCSSFQRTHDSVAFM